MKLINPEKCIVFFDFDNTISTCDVFDNMLPRFSKDDLWIRLEKDWQKGKIGSGALNQAIARRALTSGGFWVGVADAPDAAAAISGATGCAASAGVGTSTVWASSAGGA